MSNPHSSLRKTVGLVALATAALTCGAGCPTTAHATTFVDVTIEDLARASDLVVECDDATNVHFRALPRLGKGLHRGGVER